MAFKTINPDTKVIHFPQFLGADTISSGKTSADVVPIIETSNQRPQSRIMV